MANELMKLDDQEVSLIKQQLMDPDATEEELELFLYQARKTGLNPLAKQIYSVHRWNRRAGRKTMTIQVSVDGLRVIAQRSGEYGGQEGPYWCGDDGEWVDAWLSADPPRAAKVGVWRKGFNSPLWRVARWESFAQTDKQGRLTQFWAGMGEHMLAKCAESLALRAAFPQELSGLYTTEEMDQSEDVEVVDATVVHGEIEFQEKVLTADERDQMVDGAMMISFGLYDDPDAMHKKWLEHYGVSDFSSLSDAQLTELYSTLKGMDDSLISPQQLKALHAKAGDVAKYVEAENEKDGVDAEWNWDEQRPVYVNQVTKGRTTSSKKLLYHEFKDLMDWMSNIMGEETGDSLFGEDEDES
jgi:phage recombination protein Bet